MGQRSLVASELDNYSNAMSHGEVEIDSESSADDSPYSSEPNESGTVLEANFNARSKRTIPAQDVLDHLFTFDTGNVKTVKKRS